MEVIVLAVPVVTTLIMFVVKRVAGLAMFENGASNHASLRLALVLFSLIGMASTSVLTGQPIDPDSISNLVVLGLETLLSAGASHIIYTIMNALRRGDITL